MLDVFNNISTNAPNELVREYETEEGGKVTRSMTNSIWIFNDYWTTTVNLK